MAWCSDRSGPTAEGALRDCAIQSWGSIPTRPDRQRHVARAAYPTTAQVDGLACQQSLARLATLPEVESVGIVNSLPLGDQSVGIRGDVTVEGESEGAPGALTKQAGGKRRLLQRTGHTVVERRERSMSVTRQTRPALVIISEALARNLWPNEDVLGKRLTQWVSAARSGAKWSGSPAMSGNEGWRASRSRVYHPFSQVADNRRWFVGGDDLCHSHSGESRRGSLQICATSCKAVDRNLPLYNVSGDGTQVVAKRVRDPRFIRCCLDPFRRSP